MTRERSGCTIFPMEQIMQREVTTKLTNQEKSARRYASLTAFAEQCAKENQAFNDFCWDENEEKPIPTWRKLETFIKRNFEAGAKITLVIESRVGGD